MQDFTVIPVKFSLLSITVSLRGGSYGFLSPIIPSCSHRSLHPGAGGSPASPLSLVTVEQC